MSFMEQVAEAKDPREAMLYIAGALDIIFAAITEQAPAPDSWGAWETGGPEHLPVDEPEAYGGGAAARQPTQPLEQDGNGNWVIPPAPAELKQQRGAWANQYLIGLGASSGDELAPANQGDNLNELMAAYVKGGPEWLTAYDTEYVLTLPPDARQAMALDYQARGLTQEALEFSVAFLQGEATSMANVEPMADTLPGAPR